MSFKEDILKGLQDAVSIVGSQRLVCQKTGISSSSLSRWLSGKSYPNIDAVSKIFDIDEVKSQMKFFSAPDAKNEIERLEKENESHCRELARLKAQDILYKQILASDINDIEHMKAENKALSLENLRLKAQNETRNQPHTFIIDEVKHLKDEISSISNEITKLKAQKEISTHDTDEINRLKREIETLKHENIGLTAQKNYLEETIRRERKTWDLPF